MWCVVKGRSGCVGSSSVALRQTFFGMVVVLQVVERRKKEGWTKGQASLMMLLPSPTTTYTLRKQPPSQA